MPNLKKSPISGILAAIFGASLALCGGCDRSISGPKITAAQAVASSIQWSSCRLPGVRMALRCTTIKLPTRHANPNGRTLDIHVAVAAATQPKTFDDPLYFIAGGPGQGASRVAFTALSAFERIRRHRDLVFVDVRGTGRSQPMDCKLDDDATALRDALAGELGEKELASCRALHDGRDLGAYRTQAIVDDLEAIAAKLGHTAVNVYGISYGTRVALRWADRFPKRLRTMILDGVVPPEMTLMTTFATDAQEAFDQLAEDCLKARECTEKFGDVRETWRTLAARLGATVHTFSAAHPTTGKLQTIRVSLDGVAMAVRGLLYSPDLQVLLPVALSEAATGNFAPLLAQAHSLGAGAADTTSFGLLFEVACAEDLARVDAGALADSARRNANAADRSTFLGDVLLRQTLRACQIWRKGASSTERRPLRARQAVVSDVPTLLLSGRLDPVTPPKWGAMAAKTLPNSLHVVVPNAAHGCFSTGCARSLMADFIDAATTSGLDLSCVNERQRPPFFLSASGPAP